MKVTFLNLQSKRQIRNHITLHDLRMSIQCFLRECRKNWEEGGKRISTKDYKNNVRVEYIDVHIPGFKSR